LVLDYLTKHIPPIDEERRDDYDENATCLTPLQECIEDTVKEIACVLAGDSADALSEYLGQFFVDYPCSV
jgi:hypothetical protein